MKKELTNKAKIEVLKEFISYKIYCKIIDCHLTEEQLCNIYDEIEETESWWTSGFEIVNKPIGVFQDCNDGLKTWVDQQSVGECGDCFVGSVCIKIGKRKYLKWGFEI